MSMKIKIQAHRLAEALDQTYSVGGVLVYTIRAGRRSQRKQHQFWPAETGVIHQMRYPRMQTALECPVVVCGDGEVAQLWERVEEFGRCVMKRPAAHQCETKRANRRERRSEDGGRRPEPFPCNRPSAFESECADGRDMKEGEVDREVFGIVLGCFFRCRVVVHDELQRVQCWPANLWVLDPPSEDRKCAT